MASVLLLLLLLVASASAWSNTYRYFGGAVNVCPKGRNALGFFEVELRHKQATFRCFVNPYTCKYGNCGIQNQTTSYSIAWESYGLTWCQKEVVVKLKLHTNLPFGIRFPTQFSFSDGRGLWIPNAIGRHSTWKMLAHVDPGLRSDTGEFNCPPVSTMLPIVRVTRNCPRRFDLKVFDRDGDQVRCRVATSRGADECGTCRLPHGFSLDQDSCSLSYTSSGKVGYQPIELVVEDFPRSLTQLSYSNGEYSIKRPLAAARVRRQANPGFSSTTTTSAPTTTTSAPTTTTSAPTTTTSAPTTTTSAPTTTTSAPTTTTSGPTTTTSAPTTTTSAPTTTTSATTTTTSAPTTTTSAPTTTTSAPTTTTSAPTTTTPAPTTTTSAPTTTTSAPTTTTSAPTTTTSAPTTTTSAPTTTTSAPTTTTSAPTTTTPAPTTTTSAPTTTTSAPTTTTSAPTTTTSAPTTTTPAPTTTTSAPTTTTSAPTTTTSAPTTTTSAPTTTTSAPTTTTSAPTTTTSAPTTTTSAPTTTTSAPTTTTPAPTTTTPAPTTTTPAPTSTGFTTWPAIRPLQNYIPSFSVFASRYRPSIAPLSKLPLQFSVLVDSHNAPSCLDGDYFPVFLAPTPAHGVHLPAFVGQTLEFQVRVKAQYTTIYRLLLTGPGRIRQHRTSPGSYVVKWTPSEGDVNCHFPICFVSEAYDSQRRVYHSDLRCLVVDVLRHNTVVTCSQTEIKVEVEKTYLIRRYEDRLHLRDEHGTPCKLSRLSNSTHLVAVMPLNSCGTYIEDNKVNITFRNQISSSDPNDVISRHHNVDIAISCVYPKRTNVTLGFRHKNPYAFKERGFGSFTFQFEFFQSQRFRQQVEGSTYPVEVYLKQMIYMQIQATSSIPNTELFVESCRATPYDNPDSHVSYTIIEDGCVKDPTVQIYNSSRSVFRFGMEAFEFIGAHDEVYISCSVILCESGAPGTRCSKGCLPPGSHRGKREASAQTSRHSISQGPLHLKASDSEVPGVSTSVGLNLFFVVGSLLVCGAVIYRSRRSGAKYQRLPSSEID